MKVIAQRHHHSMNMVCVVFLYVRAVFTARFSFSFHFGLICFFFICSSYSNFAQNTDSLDPLQMRYGAQANTILFTQSTRIFSSLSQLKHRSNSIEWRTQCERAHIHKTNINRPHKKLLHNTFRRKSNNP